MQELQLDNPFIESSPFDQQPDLSKKIPYKILLDNIRSPYNVGAIMRSAECFGAEEILLCGITPTPENNPKINKTAKQAPLKWSYYSESVSAIQLFINTHHLYSIEKTPQSVSIQNFDFQMPCILILGNEEFGVDPLLLGKSERIIHIPLLGSKNSLNVSVAAGIVFQAISQNFL